MSTILTVDNLKLYYRTRRGIVKAVNNVSFQLERGKTLAVVGESGCGKSSLAYALIRILPRNVHEYSGIIKIDGVDVLKLSEEEFRKNYRMKKISIVPQGAMNSLNPVLKVGDQLAEPLLVHLDIDKDEALRRAAEVLENVRLPKTLLERYPHELSGGMKQRVLIAMALIMKPEIVILDEPTSALDIITQANIINFLKDLQSEYNLSYIFITHDLGVASELSDYFAVMYAGKIAEIGPAENVLTNPMHPYTEKLLKTTPRLRSESTLEFIPGSPPDLIEQIPGCSFNSRCPYAFEKCRIIEPYMIRINGQHYAACWLRGDEK